MTIEFKLPDLGEGVHEGQIVRLLVREGEPVREDQPLMEVETDKAAVEIPCPATGTIGKWHVAENQVVNVGDIMVTIQDSSLPAGEAPSEDGEKPLATSAGTVGEARTVSSAGGSTTTKAPANGSSHRRPASPAVRKLARSLGVDLAAVTGSGAGGRITRSDVEAAASAPASAVQPPSPAQAAMVSAPPAIQLTAPPPAPLATAIEPAGEKDIDAWGPVIRQPLSRPRRTIAGNMLQSWTTIPHVTDSDDADVTMLDELRQGYNQQIESGSKLTLLPFILRAVVQALQQHPIFNASYDSEAGEIIYKRYISLAVGVQTDRGLIAPVIREADQLSVTGLNDALGVIAENARAARFEVNDTRGGTFTVSNAGAMGGSRYSTPIINPPQVAVLALGRAKWQPWVIEGQLKPRFIQPLSMSFDHRIIDGGQEMAFHQSIIRMLENPATLMI